MPAPSPNARTGGVPRPVPTIPAAALTPGSITAAQLAPAAVTTANIADGSVTLQKLSVALPRLAWSGLTSGVTLLTPVGSSVVVRSVTLTIPAAGQVMANASGLFGLAQGAGFTQSASCSISTGTATEAAHLMSVATTNTTYMTQVPFAGSRVYDVTPGAFTVRLVCSNSTSIPMSNGPNLQTAQLTALFVPN